MASGAVKEPGKDGENVSDGKNPPVAGAPGEVTPSPAPVSTPVPQAPPSAKEEFEKQRKSGRSPDGPVATKDRFFSAECRLSDAHFEEPDFPGFSEACDSFGGRRCLVIVGFEPKRCERLAKYIGDKHGYSCHYSTEDKGAAIDGVNISELFEYAGGRQDPTCVVRNYIGQANSTFTIASFELAIRGLKPNVSVIVFIHPKTFERERRHWQENVLYLPLPDRISTTAPGMRDVEPAQQMAEIFAPRVTSLKELAAAGERLFIERTLVRLAVLFPETTAASFDELMKVALGEVAIEIEVGTKEVEARKPLARELWGRGHSYFEQQAGVVRTSQDGPATVGFISSKMAEAAAEWVWKNPEDLAGLLDAIGTLRILFTRTQTEDDGQLVESYTQALADVARRARGIVDSRWLERLLDDYVQWITENAHKYGIEPDAVTESMFGAASPDLRRKLWKTFVEGVEKLGNVLIARNSARVLEEFFERLIRRDLEDVLLQIIHRMGENLSAEIGGKYIEEIVKRSRQEAREWAISELAYFISWFPRNAAPLLERLQRWATPSGDGTISELQDAAIVFPAYLFDFTAYRTFDANGATSPLMDALQITAGSQTLADICSASLARPEYPERAGYHYFRALEEDIKERGYLALAVTLLWAAMAFPDAEIGKAFLLSKSALAGKKMSERIQVSQYWRQIADHSREMRRQLPRDGTPLEARRKADWERQYELAKALMRN